MKALRIPQAVPLALVHHANQYLITDRYDNRQGIVELVEGYAAALRMHERYNIPANLHLSGTLIEAVAWYCPWFLRFVRDLRQKGIVALVGGTYAENVMPLFSSTFNRRQLDEYLWLCQHHLGCDPSEITICWIPERVWDTDLLAPVLTSPGLANGGYRYVLLDDRLLYPVNGTYNASPRARFDAIGPYNHYERVDGRYTQRESNAHEEISTTDTRSVWRIANGGGLSVIPISANLRYWTPPLHPEHWRLLESTVAAANLETREHTLLVYADDLEKTAGVGGWDPGALARYDTFLQWVATRGDIRPTLLPEWLAQLPPRGERMIEPGTFYEIAQSWQADETYQGWWNNATWAPYKDDLVTAQYALELARHLDGNERLLRLGWKHLLASAYETAWHDPADGERAPAPWAKAVAHHARSCLLIAAAARWFGRTERAPFVEKVDVDGDGDIELILGNASTYAVLSPSQGGRLIALFAQTPRGPALVVGNPTDDWNFQQELNRFMDWPPNHPGAMADKGGEHDSFHVVTAEVIDGHAVIELLDEQAGHPLYGMRKHILLLNDSPALLVCYQLPADGSDQLTTDFCLSPDYYRLLRHGRQGVSRFGGTAWRGVNNEDVAVWVGLASDENVTWAEPSQTEVGHGFNLRVQAHTQHTHLLLGCGPTDNEHCQQLIAQARDLLHQLTQAPRQRLKTMIGMEAYG